MDKISGRWASLASGRERRPPLGQDSRSLTIMVNIFCRIAFNASLSISFWVSEIFKPWVVGESQVGGRLGLEL